MKCPFCSSENTRVIDSRPADVSSRRIFCCKILYAAPEYKGICSADGGMFGSGDCGRYR